MKTRYYLIAGTMATVATSSAFAAPRAEDIAKKTVASKYYVDEIKQDKLGPLSSDDEHAEFYDGMPEPVTGQTISLTKTLGEVGKLYIAGGLEDPLTKEEDAEAIGKYVVGDGDISSSNGLDRRDVEGALASLQLVHDVYSELNNSIGSLSWTALSWSTSGSNNDQIGTTSYSTSFSTTGTGHWPSDHAASLVTGQALAYGLALKQNKLPAKTSSTNFVPAANQALVLGTSAGSPDKVYTTGGGSQALTTTTNAPAVINYVTGANNTTLSTFTAGTFGTDTSANQGLVKNALVSLELLKDVYSTLNASVSNTLEWSTSGTGNTQTATDQYSTSFNGTANNWKAADQTKIVTGDSLAKGLARKQNKMECAGSDSTSNPAEYTDANCWLWKVRD